METPSLPNRPTSAQLSACGLRGEMCNIFAETAVGVQEQKGRMAIIKEPLDALIATSSESLTDSGGLAQGKAGGPALCKYFTQSSISAHWREDAAGRQGEQPDYPHCTRYQQRGREGRQGSRGSARPTGYWPDEPEESVRQGPDPRPSEVWFTARNVRHWRPI